MSKWKFIFTDRDGLKTEVQNPINWNNPQVNISREHEQGWHGIFFDYGVDKLVFSGLGFQLLKAEYDSYGFNGEMRIDIQYQCSESNLFDNFYQNGRLAFDQYEDTCGDECTASIGVEDSDDIILFKNNYEQKVDITKNIAFDQNTILDDYNFLNFDLEIPSRGLPVKSSATNQIKFTFYVSGVVTKPAINSKYTNNLSTFIISSVNINSGSGSIETTISNGTNVPQNSGVLTKVNGIGDNTISFNSFSTNNSFGLLDYPNWGLINLPGTTGTEQGAILPIFSTLGLSEIDNTNINSGPYYNTDVVFNDGDNSVGPTPFIDLLDNQQLRCSPKQLNIKYLIEGRLIDNSFATRNVVLTANIRVGPNPSNTSILVTQTLFNYSTNNPNKITDFSAEFEGVQSVNAGDKIYVYLYITYIKTSSASIQNLTIEFYNKNNIEFSGVSYCNATTSKSSMINEACSRISESITNNKIKFYSETFGRLNSEPYAIGVNSCAGLMAITNGLYVRRMKLQDGSDPGFFVSMKDLFDGLKPIWNIGLTIEPDKQRPGYRCLRFEEWRYFYQNDVGIVFRYATKIIRKADINRAFNKLTAGYNKWEAEGSTGLYELMTKRTYRLNINSINKELNISSDFICSPYTIEITRRLDESTQDWKYDNDVFGICVKEDHTVETFLDSATSVSNVPDSNTAYNGRITPVRNIMRWFNFIMQSFRQLQIDSRLIFSSGEGNYVARLKINNCAIEGKVMAENEDIDLGDFNDMQAAKPITFPELVEFEHPMNYNTFKRLKDDPTLRYKAVEYYCNGVASHGWLDEISYRPEEGIAQITVIPKNNLQLPEPPDMACHATILTGSLTITDCGAGCRQIDFTEGVTGATYWYYLVTKGTVPAQGEGFSATTSEHPFTIEGLTPGDWSIYIVPYCDIDNIGENYVADTFNIPAPPAPQIQLKMDFVNPGFGISQMKLSAIATNGAFSQSFSFRFGQCNTGSNGTFCNGFPSAPYNQNSYATLIANAGDTLATQIAGANSQYPGSVTKVVLHGLSNITPSQITKAPGQTWSLEFE